MTAQIPTEQPTPWQQAEDIMTALGATDRTSDVQISRAIEVLGIDVVEAVVMEARTAEVNGGLHLKGGERRTLSGIFFYLLRDRCTPEQRRHIF